MTNTENQSVDTSKTSNQGGPIFLLLFVGFIIGLITGFVTKDVIVGQLVRAIHRVVKTDDNLVGDFPEKRLSTKPGVTETDVVPENNADTVPLNSNPPVLDPFAPAVDKNNEEKKKKEEDEEPDKTPADREIKPLTK